MKIQKFIILVDKEELYEQKLTFLSIFEKHIISFESFLDEKLKAETINDLIKKMISVNDINYDLNSLLINISENIINGYYIIIKIKKIIHMKI